MIERWFRCRERGSTWTTEVTAGISTFLALSYIFVVNPAILSQAGMSAHAVLFATIVTSAAATLAMGLWANLPYVLAPGLEINTYIAFYAVAVVGLSWPQALGAVFWSGILFLLFTLSGVRERILESLPDALKTALAVAVGTLLAAVALRLVGVLRYDGNVLAGAGEAGKPFALLLITAAIAFVLNALRVRTAVLISIVAGAALAPLLGIIGARPPSTGSVWEMVAAAGAADLSILLQPRGWTIVLVLFLVDFYGSVAKLVGLICNTSVLRDGKLPGLREALVVDGAAASTGAMLGTTSVLVYAESGVGIAAGGRTGLTAVTAALAMLGCFAAAPLLAHVPVEATSGALLYVAWRLFPRGAELRRLDAWELAAIAGMSAIVLFTFALDRALLFGLAVHLARDFWRGVRLNAYSIGSIGLLVIGWLASP